MRNGSFCIAVLFVLLIGFSCNKACVDRFNLNFNYSDSTDFVWMSSVITTPIVDSLESIDSKFPVYLEAKPFLHVFWGLKVELFQTFVMPQSFCQSREIEITIHNKCIRMDSMTLIVSGVNRQGEVIKTDLLDINNEGEWCRKSLKIYFDEIVYFSVSLMGEGRRNQLTDEGVIPRFYLDRISIQIDGKDINRIKGVNNLSDRKEEQLISEFIYPLTLYDTGFLKDIGLEKKRIVALGETVHGSKTVNRTAFEMIKNMIIHNHCKLVLLEYDVASSLKHTLFVQGKLPENEIWNIREEEHSLHFEMEAFIEFLMWLREYNETEERKVLLLGLLDVYNFIKSPLYDFVFAFYDEKQNDLFYPLLDHLHRGKLEDALLLTVESGDRLRSVLGEEAYFLLRHVLGKLNTKGGQEVRLNLDNYNYYMWLNADTFLSWYLREEEKGCIYAHYGHIKKKEGMQKNPSIPRMGNFLNDRYGDKYGVVAITVGVGEITTRETASMNFAETVLEEVDKGSLEALGMKNKQECYYYPSAQLLYDLYSIRDIGNKENPYGKNQIVSLLKANTDGFVFLQTSEGFNDSYSYEKEYGWNKGVGRADFLKSIRTVN